MNDTQKSSVFLSVSILLTIAVAFGLNLAVKYFFPEPTPIIEVRTCLDSEIFISEWSFCSEGKQRRVISLISDPEGNTPKCNIDTSKYVLEQSCEVPRKTITILEGYTSDFSDLNQIYNNNFGNVRLISKGKFKSVKLNVQADTYVLGGQAIRIPEKYYFMFSLNDKDTRVIGATRNNYNRLDPGSPGLFQGTETPKTLTFDLGDIMLAAASNELGKYENGFTRRNFLPTFDSEVPRDLRMTLYVGDGNSMLDSNPKKRIYGRIIKANLEYECEGECYIEKS